MTEISLQQHRDRLAHLDTPGGRLAYLDVGPRDGHPVLLVHGMPTSSYLYRHIAPLVAARGFRVIAPDLLGFGASDKPRELAEYDVRRQAARLTTLLDRLGVPSATFVPHDLGGPWTFEIADRAPERIASLVLLNTSAYAELMRPPREARLVGGPLGGALAALMGSRMGRPLMDKFFRDYTARETRLGREVLLAHWVPLHEGGTRAFRVFAQHLDEMMAEFSRYAAALRRLEVPAAVVWGGEDPVLRRDRILPRFVTDLAIEPRHVHVLEGASHFLQEDRPSEVAGHIAAFVADVHPARQPTL